MCVLVTYIKIGAARKKESSQGKKMTEMKKIDFRVSFQLGYTQPCEQEESEYECEAALYYTTCTSIRGIVMKKKLNVTHSKKKVAATGRDHKW